MQSKRDGLVPICEMLGELPAPLKPAKPQAVCPFTQADQVNALVSASEAAADRGFMARRPAPLRPVQAPNPNLPAGPV